MAEQLCNNCELRNSIMANPEQSVEVARAQPDDPDDLKEIAMLPSGMAILAALQESRPVRCELLRELLPAVPPTKAGTIQYNRCPEIGLIAIFGGTDNSTDF